VELIDILAPTWGLVNDEIVLTKWLKRVGDSVSADEVLAEAEGDKTTGEILSQVDGVLVEVLAPEGANVAPGDVVGRIRQTTSLPH
jgi:pyruvate/2-oxoglutarate dehydrogenase complex dihydrolipoamide acyltransferase (E2) component